MRLPPLLVPRPRVVRDREPALRAAGFRAGFAGLVRAADDVDFARAAGFFAVVDLRAAGLRAAGLRALLLRAPDERDAVPGAAAAPSSAHLPDITRCAASATASAISEPSLAALEATLLAAWVAVSAASSPASRIALRALGLALIAAAAAASPAASISLLIAALAILSTVLLPPPLERDDDDLEELFFADLAIACFSLLRRKRHFRAVTVPKFARKSKQFRRSPTCKGHRRNCCSDALRHGQRPEMWPSVST